MHAKSLVLTLFVFTAAMAFADRKLVTFDRQILSDRFYSEGACHADIDGDGDQDIVSGPFWYAGPDFATRHAYMDVLRFAISQYSRHFFSFAHDFNGDNRPDILAVPMPGQPAQWFENPGTTDSRWKQQLAFEWVGNESPELIDLTGDGRVELVFCYEGKMGYAEPDWNDPEESWTFTAITPERGYVQFTHGLGIGDVNGDGRADVLETHGWWEQPEKKGELFRLHEVRFAHAGGAQMYTYDFDGDGDNDVVSSQNAHGYGLSWFEQVRDASGEIQFKEHRILTENPADNPHGLSFSQMHALNVADINGDGIDDIVTGKRFYAHGGADPGAHELPVLYWFETVRSNSGVEFIPWLIDDRAGVGTQLTVGDVTGDGLTDVVVGNKVGTSLLRNQTQTVSEAAYEASKPARRDTARHTAGTDIFATHVRPTEALSPEEELAAFSVPAGFEVQLVAAEPEIAKPLNMAFDAKGRLWITNTLEYPYAAPKDRKGRDSIKVLEDFDLNGRAHKVTTFADDLNIPIGLYPYKDGVICFSIPNIWFMRDIDGDGRADEREVLYGPFGYERDTHGMINSFTRGADGWIYACHGYNNTSSVAGKDGHTISMQSGNIFRFRPDGSRIELYTHGQVNPFGMAIDRWGDIFTADCHTRPVSMLLQGGHHESFGKPHDGLGFIPPLMEHSHGSTAICGMALGTATAFPDSYRNSAFGGDVMTCRVHRDHLVYIGSSPRAEEAPDLLISGDPWFRPVDLQVGPDGALYVADFYNKIIGHYEVKLDHPGRDRHRGRIWRIVHRRATGRAVDFTTQSPAELAETLHQVQGSPASLALDRLTDHFGKDGEDAARTLFTAPEAPQRHVGLWALHRIDALESADLTKAISDSESLIRAAAMQMIGERRDSSDRVDDWLSSAIRDDESPRVQRSAVMAAAQRPHEALVRPLIERYHQTPEADRHLRHAIKIALRNHLENEAWFRTLASSELTRADSALITDVCLAIKTSASGEFVVSQLEHFIGRDAERLKTLAAFGARHVSENSVDRLVTVIRSAFAENTVEQLALLESVRQGLAQKGAVRSPAVRSWALDLAREQLVPVGEGEPLRWDYIPYPGTADEGNPWMLSRRRNSADGEQHSRLWSSFPKGEQRTGSFRSAPFVLGDRFHFYLAGHDGFPASPLAGKNRVELRDATTHAVVRKTAPPRNDIAQRIEWDTSDLEGTKVYVALIDGDSGNAFAWLAAGRFSVPDLNASDLPGKRETAANLIATFRLDELRPQLDRLVSDSGVDASSRAAMARALAAFHEDPHAGIVADLFVLRGASEDLRTRAAAFLVKADASGAGLLIDEGLAVAVHSEQVAIASKLAADRDGAALLLAAVTAGRASPQVLARQEIAQKLEAVTTPEQKTQFADLTKNMVNEDAEVEKRIAARNADYLGHGGSVETGKAVFAQYCAVCHQVAGVGGQLAPNLDGIGNRGIDRVLEDLLAPNRNVDVAFRATTVMTRDGTAHFGFIRRREDGQVYMADSAGNEFMLPADNIAEEIPSPVSLMPPNFDEVLAESEFRDLMAYLLSLRGN